MRSRAAMVLLLEANPRRPSDGVQVVRRAAGGGAHGAYAWDNASWQPALISWPQLQSALGFDGLGPGSGGSALVGAVTLSLRDGRLDDWAELVWRNAPMSLRVGREDEPSPAALVSGRVADASVGRDGEMTLTLADPGAEFRRPALTATFAGSGGLEGTAELKGKLKRWLLGPCFNLAGVLVDPANLIYWLGPNIASIDAVRFEGVAYAPLVVVPWAGSTAATLAALQTAVLANGACLVAPSIGCVRPWRTPNVLTADVNVGQTTTVADLMQGLIQLRLPASVFAAGTVAALASARPDPHGWMIDDEGTLGDHLDAIARGASAWWRLTLAGAVKFGAWGFGAPTMTLTLTDLPERRTILTPAKRRAVLWKRNSRVQGDDEIAAVLQPASGELFDDFAGYGAVGDAPWSVTGPAEASVVASTDLGGRCFEFGTNAGNDEFVLLADQGLSFAPEDLYRIDWDVEVMESSGGGTLWLGVACRSAGGAVLVSDGGLFATFAGAGVAQAIGRSIYSGYFRGAAANGGGFQTGMPALTPDSAKPVPSGTVEVRPVLTGNFAAQPGRIRVHAVRLRKVEDLSPVHKGVWAAGTYYRGDQVAHGDWIFIARRTTTASPPATAISTADWAFTGATAARAVSWDPLNRNGSFEQLAGASIVGWEADIGVMVSQASGNAKMGQRVARLVGRTQILGDAFPVAPGQTLFLRSGFLTTVNDTAGVFTGTAYWYLGLQLAQDHVGAWIADEDVYPLLYGGPFAVADGYRELAVAYVVPATIAGGAKVPRFARPVISFEGGDPASNAEGYVDYFHATAAEAGATVGAPAGTTVAGRDAATVAGTVKADGTINTDKVVTASIAVDAITDAPVTFATTSIVARTGTSWQDLTGFTLSLGGLAADQRVALNFHTAARWAAGVTNMADFRVVWRPVGGAAHSGTAIGAPKFITATSDGDVPVDFVDQLTGVAGSIEIWLQVAPRLIGIAPGIPAGMSAAGCTLSATRTKR